MNKKKGFTLVEVLVSITIFLTVFSVILSTYYLAQKRVYKQEETQYIENLCLDIDKIYDNEGYEGLVKHYEFEALEGDNVTLKEVEFNPVDDKYFKKLDYTIETDESGGDESGGDESGEDNTNVETTSTENESSSDDNSESKDEEENVNQIKEVVKHLILIKDKEDDTDTYLGTIDKTLSVTNNRDEISEVGETNEDGTDKVTIEEGKTGNDNSNKKYDVSIQKFTRTYGQTYCETISKVNCKSKEYSLNSSSIYLDSNYRRTTNESLYKYKLDYSYYRFLYELNTLFEVDNSTYQVVETYNKYTTTASYTYDETITENDGYTKDEKTQEYTPTESEINYQIKKRITNKVDPIEKKYIEYIMDIQKTTKLTISITNIKDNYVLIKDLEYGSSKYDDTYINSIKELDDKGETGGNE